MSEFTPKTILVEVRDHVAWITINRPDAMNALARETVIEIDQALQLLEARADVHALVFTGQGRAFCAGGDLKYFKETVGSGDMNKFRAYLNLCQNMYRRVENFPHPTIAAVNGVAVAGGMELIISCDLVIAAESAKIGDGRQLRHHPGRRRGDPPAAQDPHGPGQAPAVHRQPAARRELAEYGLGEPGGPGRTVDRGRPGLAGPDHQEFAAGRAPESSS